MTGIEQWNHQLQCHCLTVFWYGEWCTLSFLQLLVEMICSSELKVSLAELEETLEVGIQAFK